MEDALGLTGPALAMAATAIGLGALWIHKRRAAWRGFVDLFHESQRVGDMRVWDSLLEWKKGKAQLAVYVTLRRCD
jgi:hypothetical protein